MTGEIAILPSKDQISAAQELYKDTTMEYWRLEDDIMRKLKDRNPEITDKAITLVKVTLVNTFYSAGCPDVDEMTSWMVTQKPCLLERYKNIASHDEEERIKWVQRIARRASEEEGDNTQQVSGNAFVFASKFAHFFIDEEAFPIYDQYARMVVNSHLGETKKVPLKDWYRTFYKHFFKMKRYLDQRDSCQYSIKALDHYLWLSGMYITQKLWDLPPDQLNLYGAAENLFIDSDNPFLEQLFPLSLLDSFPIEQLHELPKWKDVNRKIQRKQKEEAEKRQK